MHLLLRPSSLAAALLLIGKVNGGEHVKRAVLSGANLLIGVHDNAIHLFILEILVPSSDVDFDPAGGGGVVRKSALAQAHDIGLIVSEHLREITAASHRHESLPGGDGLAVVGQTDFEIDERG